MQKTEAIRKKILFIITKGNFGGAQKYVYDLATNLNREKFEAVVTCGDGDLFIERLKNENIRTIKIDGLDREIKVNTDLKVLKNLIKIIKEEKPNIVHLNSSKIGLLGSLAVLYLKIVNSKLKISAVFTAHGWGFYEKHRAELMRYFFYFSHWLTVLICDKTIAVSKKTKDDIAWLPFIKNKITVIHNGIENFETLNKDESRKILSRNYEGKIIIFSLSELHRNKGLDVAMRGITRLPKELIQRITYSIAGSGEEKENLEKLATELGIKESINFMGFTDNAKKLLSGADIFLFPSRTENLPFAVLEAGLVGLPIIATSVGGIPEIITDMQNGILVHPNNPREISEAIQYLLSHKEKTIEFGEKIREMISANFSLEKMLQETMDIYFKLLALNF